MCPPVNRVSELFRAVDLCLSDILPGVPTAVQLRHPGADGALALPPGVDRHLLHPEPGLGENSRGDALKTCPSPTHQWLQFRCRFFIYLFIWILFGHKACRILVTQQGLNLCPLQWEYSVLTAGSPEKSSDIASYCKNESCKSQVPWMFSFRVSQSQVDSVPLQIYIPSVSNWNWTWKSEHKAE